MNWVRFASFYRSAPVLLRCLLMVCVWTPQDETVLNLNSFAGYALSHHAYKRRAELLQMKAVVATVFQWNLVLSVCPGALHLPPWQTQQSQSMAILGHIKGPCSPTSCPQQQPTGNTLGKV